MILYRAMEESDSRNAREDTRGCAFEKVVNYQTSGG
jgi:hypothetical protein